MLKCAQNSVGGAGNWRAELAHPCESCRCALGDDPSAQLHLLRGRCGASCTGEVGAIEAAATAAGEDGSVLQRAENWAGRLKDPRHANKTGGAWKLIFVVLDLPQQSR